MPSTYYTRRLQGTLEFFERHPNLPDPFTMSISFIARTEPELRAIIDAFGRPDPEDITEGDNFFYYQIRRPNMVPITVDILKKSWTKPPRERFTGLLADILPPNVTEEQDWSEPDDPDD